MPRRRIDAWWIFRAVLWFVVGASFTIMAVAFLVDGPEPLMVLPLVVALPVLLTLFTTSEWQIEQSREEARVLASGRAVHFHENVDWLRGTERYAGTAEQLESGDVDVRMAGMRELQRLTSTEVDPERRQKIADLLCTYLSRPFDPSTVEGDDGYSAEERQSEPWVRRCAQQILTAHLRHGPDENPLFWADIDLVLDGAQLQDWDMSACWMRKASFEYTQFAGHTTFADAKIDGPAIFNEAEFGERVSFDRVQFASGVGFGAARFGGGATFNGASFDGVARYIFEAHDPIYSRTVMFNGAAWFASARFWAPTSFDNADFWGRAMFVATQFERNASFLGTVFHDQVSFRGAWFGESESSSNS